MAGESRDAQSGKDEGSARRTLASKGSLDRQVLLRITPFCVGLFNAPPCHYRSDTQPLSLCYSRDGTDAREVCDCGERCVQGSGVYEHACGSRRPLTPARGYGVQERPRKPDSAYFAEDLDPLVLQGAVCVADEADLVLCVFLMPF